MKHQWLAYLVLGVLSIGAGVAIAGMPNNVPVDATIVPPTTSEAPAPTVPETTVPETTAPETTVPDTTDSVPVEMPDRSGLSVAAANGADTDGAASRAAARLEEIGYVDVLSLNGTEVLEFTSVYFVEGFDEAALRLAADLELLDDFVAPIELMPAVADLPADIQLVAYIGIDRA